MPNTITSPVHLPLLIQQHFGPLELWANLSAEQSLENSLQNCGITEPSKRPYIVISGSPELLEKNIGLRAKQTYNAADPNKSYVIFEGYHKAQYAISKIIKWAHQKCDEESNSINQPTLDQLYNIDAALSEHLTNKIVPPAAKIINHLTFIGNLREIKEKNLNLRELKKYQDKHGNHYILKTGSSAHTKLNELEAAGLAFERMLIGPHRVPEVYAAWNQYGQRIGTLSQHIHSMTTFRDFDDDNIKDQHDLLLQDESFFAVAVSMYIAAENDGHSGNMAIGKIRHDGPEQCLRFDGDQSDIQHTAKYSFFAKPDDWFELPILDGSRWEQPKNIFNPTSNEINVFPRLTSSNPSNWIDNRKDDEFYHWSADLNQLPQEQAEQARYWIYRYLLKTIVLTPMLTTVAAAHMQSGSGQEKYIARRQAYLDKIRTACLNSENFVNYCLAHWDNYLAEIDAEIKDYNSHTSCDNLKIDLSITQKSDDLQQEIQQAKSDLSQVKMYIDAMTLLSQQQRNIDFSNSQAAKQHIQYLQLVHTTIDTSLRERKPAIDNHYQHIITNTNTRIAITNEFKEYDKKIKHTINLEELITLQSNLNSYSNPDTWRLIASNPALQNQYTELRNIFAAKINQSCQSHPAVSFFPSNQKAEAEAEQKVPGNARDTGQNLTTSVNSESQSANPSLRNY